MCPGTTTVILIPGFKGTELRNRRGRLIWPGLTAMATRRPLLRPVWASGRPDYSGLSAGRVVRSVGLPFPPVGAQIYGPLLRVLHNSHSTSTVKGLGWDWRQAPWRAAAVLDRQVRAALSAGAGRIRLVAHSLGAVVAAWWLCYGTSSPRNARRRRPGPVTIDLEVVVGAFGGSAKMFRVLQVGDVVAGNRHLLDAQTLAMFESSWFLLPREQFVRRFDGTPWKASLTQAATWRNAGWRPWCEPSGQFLSTEVLDFAGRMLAESAEFHERLRIASRPVDLGMVTNVVSAARPTLTRVFADERGGLVLTAAQRDAEPCLEGRTLSAPGDGTLTLDAMRLPPAFANGARTVRIDAEHIEILRDERLFRQLAHSTDGRR